MAALSTRTIIPFIAERHLLLCDVQVAWLLLESEASVEPQNNLPVCSEAWADCFSILSSSFIDQILPGPIYDYIGVALFQPQPATCVLFHPWAMNPMIFIASPAGSIKASTVLL